MSQQTNTPERATVQPSDAPKADLPPGFPPGCNVLVAPLWVVTPEGHPVLRVGVNDLELFDPRTYEPRIRLGPLAVLDAGAPGTVESPAMGVQVLAPGGALKAALVLMEHPDQRDNTGRVLLYGDAVLPGAELSGRYDGGGALYLMAPTPEFPDHPGVEIYTQDGQGQGIFSNAAEDGVRVIATAPDRR